MCVIQRETLMKKLLTVLLLCISTVVPAHHHGPEPSDGKVRKLPQSSGDKLTLSADVRTLLRQEMRQIKGGMESLVLATVSAQWGQIAAVGQRLKHSYIFKQKLTAKQRHELTEQLPDEFKRLDKKLHQYADMLSHVARERDIELVNYYIYKINETCTGCHARFVKNKFAGFTESE